MGTACTWNPRNAHEQEVDNLLPESRAKRFPFSQSKHHGLQHLTSIATSSRVGVYQQTKVYGDAHPKVTSLANDLHGPLPSDPASHDIVMPAAHRDSWLAPHRASALPIDYQAGWTFPSQGLTQGLTGRVLCPKAPATIHERQTTQRINSQQINCHSVFLPFQMRTF